MTPTIRHFVIAGALVSAGVLGAGIAVTSLGNGAVATTTVSVPSGGLELKDIPASDFAQNQPQPWMSGDPAVTDDGKGGLIDEYGCPVPNPYSDIVSDWDYAQAKADADPLVLKCSIDRRVNP